MKRTVLVLSLVIISIGLDRWTKMLALRHLKGQPIQDVVGEYLQFIFVENEGAFLSFGANFPDALRLIALTILPAILLVGLFIYTLFGKGMNTWQIAAFSLISGGGLSNLYDRIMEGKVVDFLLMGIGSLRTGIFNVADMAIMAGLFMMLPYMFKSSKKEPAPDQGAEASKTEEH
ncbi:MAG: signal peptidase II [Saprospiraceae bacterium]|nr:signal peptidase II [Saprospiraceae bacterium]